MFIVCNVINDLDMQISTELNVNRVCQSVPTAYIMVGGQNSTNQLVTRLQDLSFPITKKHK